MYLSPFTILLLLLEGKESSTGSPLQILHEFIVPKFININNNSDGVNSFNGTNVAIVDVDYWKDKGSAEGKIFITTPRQKPGTIASLSTIVKENSESVLSPYPSAEANLPTCNNIVSAFRTQADSCNRLWVIDTGVVDSALEVSKRICPSKVLIYDLKTDKLISKHEVPDKILKPDSLLTTIVTDIRGNQCENAFAYIADVQGYQIIVFDLKNETFWQFHNKYHYPDPTEGTFNINGVTFDLMDGILGLALGPVIKGDRTLFFHSVASRRESWVQTSVLQNRSLAGDLNSASEYFKTSTGTRSSKSAAESMDKYGVLFFGLLEENTLACWPSWVPYRSTNIKKLVKDNEKLQFISGIKVVGDDLWILSSKLQNFFADKVDNNKINYRVIRVSIDQLTRGTKCRRTRREIYHENYKNNTGTEDFSNHSILSLEENNEDDDIIT